MSQGGKWALKELLLTPFQLDGDVGRHGHAAQDELFEAHQRSRGGFREVSTPLQVLLQDYGGFPRPTRVLAERILLRSTTSGGPYGMMDLGVAVSIYDEVSSYMARPVSVGAFQMLSTNVVDLITGVVLAVLAGIPVHLEGNGVGNFSFDAVANAGIASYVPVDGAGIYKRVMPTITVVALAAVLKLHRVLVLPDDPLAMNPFVIVGSSPDSRCWPWLDFKRGSCGGSAVECALCSCVTCALAPCKSARWT